MQPTYGITNESRRLLEEAMKGGLRGRFRAVAYAPCRHASHHGRQCKCKKKMLGVREGTTNLLTNVFANFFRAAILGTTTTIPDTSNTGRSITKTVDGGIASLAMHAGTTATAATVADYKLGTTTENQVSVTVNAVSGTGSSGTFTVTATITAGADRAYVECGLYIVTTTTGWIFCIAHDTFAALNVSNTGTLAVTYTFTNS